MRIALVHELLTMRGGAERMLKVVADMFPDAPIYTLLYDEKKLGEWFNKERVITSKLQHSFSTHYSLLTTHSINHHLFLRRFPHAIEAFDFSDYDLVLSFSSAFVHGLKTRGMTKHLCYVHTPARYLWDQTFDVLDRAEQGFLGKWKRAYLERTFHKLRQWDARTSERPDKILAASNVVKRRIELYWRRESDVLYPPVDTNAFPLFTGKREEYYVLASSLVPYKRIELAIEACNRLKRRLLIVGEGPSRKALEKLSSGTIEFLGYLEHSALVPVVQKARAFLFPGEEDFGIAPLEAMSTGTPVIAFGKGGALETVLEGKTGEFFQNPNVDSLLETMQKYESQNQNADGIRFGTQQKSYSAQECRAQAEKFSQAKFKENLQRTVEKIMDTESRR